MISTDYSSYDFEDNIKEITLHIDDAAITMAAHTIAGLKINGITETITIADLYMNGKGSGGFKIADYTHYDRIADYYRNLRIEELCLPQNIKKYSTGNRFDGTNILETACSQMRGNSIEELSELYISADMKYSIPFKDDDD